MNNVYLSIRGKSLKGDNQYGISAYAYVLDFIEQPERAKYRYADAFHFSTANRVELLGIIHALEWLEPSKVTVFTNNSVVVNGINKIDLKQLTCWDGVRNADLWNKLIVLCQKHYVIGMRKETSMALSDCKKEAKKMLNQPKNNDIDGMTVAELRECIQRLQQQSHLIEQQLDSIDAKKIILTSAIEIISEFEREYDYSL